ncbi:MAG: response regulator [Verrucomicrobiales bacterium]
MSPAQAMLTTPNGSKKTILVVDDEPGIREFLDTFLKSKSFRVLLAEDGLDAMQVWSSQRDNIDILLTDIVMPGMAGTDLAQRLLEAKPTLKVLYMSGYLPVEIAEEQLSGFKFLRKPFHPSELLNALREL